MLFSLIIVYLYGNTMLQLALISILNFILILILFFNKPYTNRKHACINIVTEFLLIGIQAVMGYAEK